jgi:hypothetical protein
MSPFMAALTTAIVLAWIGVIIAIPLTQPPTAEWVTLWFVIIFSPAVVLFYNYLRSL